MALDARATWENITKSLNVYVRTNLQVAQSIAVVYPFGDPPDALPNTWIEVQYVPLVPLEFLHQSVGSSAYANLAQVLVNINCMERLTVRQGKPATYSLVSLVDTVRGVFLPPTRIAINDYDTGGDPQVGKLTVMETTPQPVGSVAETQVEVINVSVRLKYLESFTI